MLHRFIITSLQFLLPATFLTAQVDSIQADAVSPKDTVLSTFGYIVVECDSPGINIFVDGMLVGQIPIKKPITVPPGKHTVTYLHPELLKLLVQYYGEQEIRTLVSRGLQTVYIVPGQTVTVNLWWRPYDRELKSRRYRFLVKSAVGIALLVAIIGLNIP